jgi:uncharacterized protein (TIGR03435 family)
MNWIARQRTLRAHDLTSGRGVKTGREARTQSVWLIIALVSLSAAAIAQDNPAITDQPPPHMTFDVASIRPVKEEAGHLYPSMEGGFQPPNSSHYSARSIAIVPLLRTAFSLPTEYETIDGYLRFVPNMPFIYTIEARSDEETDRQLATLPKFQLEAEQHHMLQAVLIDRFKLKFHWEDRLVSGYRLVVAKHGSKLHPADSLPLDAYLEKRKGNPSHSRYHVVHDALSGNLVVARGDNLSAIVSIAEVYMGSPIQDATGLNAEYDFDLRVSDPTRHDSLEQNPQAWPQIADALRDELGLRLEPAKIVQKTLVIDLLEAPSAN